MIIWHSVYMLTPRVLLLCGQPHKQLYMVLLITSSHPSNAQASPGDRGSRQRNKQASTGCDIRLYAPLLQLLPQLLIHE